MTRKEILEHLEEVYRLLQEEVDVDELTDYARYEACVSLDSAMQHIKENEDREW